jgi:hypothetical protein
VKKALEQGSFDSLAVDGVAEASTQKRAEAEHDKTVLGQDLDAFGGCAGGCVCVCAREKK